MIGDLATRLIAQVPEGSPDGAQPPPGVVIAVHTPTGDRVAAAGRKSVGEGKSVQDV